MRCDVVPMRGPAVNTMGLVGHSTLRPAVLDRLDRAASRVECAEIRPLLDQALEEGAIGLSTGLYYKPANATSTAEVIAVSEPSAATQRPLHHASARRGRPHPGGDGGGI